jgi:hypothetical protein
MRAYKGKTRLSGTLLSSCSSRVLYQEETVRLRGCCASDREETALRRGDSDAFCSWQEQESREIRQSLDSLELTDSICRARDRNRTHATQLCVSATRTDVPLQCSRRPTLPCTHPPFTRRKQNEWHCLHASKGRPKLVNDNSDLLVGEKVRRERRWTSAGETPARELVRSTR